VSVPLEKRSVLVYLSTVLRRYVGVIVVGGLGVLTLALISTPPLLVLLLGGFGILLAGRQLVLLSARIRRQRRLVETARRAPPRN